MTDNTDLIERLALAGAQVMTNAGCKVDVDTVTMSYLRGQAAQFIAMLEAYTTYSKDAPTEWRSMESAPKDGTHFLVYCTRYIGQNYVTLCWRVQNDWHIATGGEFLVRDIVAWMPLPEGPKK